MSIETKAKYLLETKVLLRNAINRVGGELSTTDSFRSYASYLSKNYDSLVADFDSGVFSLSNSPAKQNRATSINLEDIFTVTRNSGGGRINQFGLYEWVGNDIPRIDHDFTTLSTSTSTVDIGYGEKTFTTTVEYSVGDPLVISYDVSNYIRGVVTDASPTSVTVSVTTFVGSGAYSNWTIIKCLGLLIEETRTNLFEYSETPNGTSDVFSSSGATSETSSFGILGNTTSLYVQRDSFDSFVMQNYNPTPGEQYVLSFVVKMLNGNPPSIGDADTNDFRVAIQGSNEHGLTPEIVAIGDNAYLVSYIFTADTFAFSSTFDVRKTPTMTTNSFWVTGWQLEAGSFRGSYIRTPSNATVTRAQENINVAVDGWFNTTEGSMILHYDFTDNQPALTGRRYPGGMWSGTGVVIGLYASGSLIKQDPTPTTVIPGVGLRLVESKIGYTYGAGVQNICVDGETVSTDTDIGVDASLATRMDVANSITYSGHVKSIRYRPRRLTNSQLQEKTS